jgi:hypothetical protein
MFARQPQPQPQPQHSIDFWMVSLPAWFLTGHVRSLAYGLRSAAFRSIEDRKTWMMIFKNIHAAFLSRESWMAWHGECVWIPNTAKDKHIQCVSCVYFTRPHLLGILMSNDSILMSSPRLSCYIFLLKPENCIQPFMTVYAWFMTSTKDRKIAQNVS